MTLTLSPREIVEKAEARGNPGLLSRAPRWPRVRLGEIARVINGAAYPSRNFNKEQRGMPLIRIRDVGSDRISTWYDGDWENRHLVRHGDLLVGMDGEFRVATWLHGDALLNQRVCRIEATSDTYDRRFLSLVLQGYIDAIWAETSSTTVKHLSSRSIADIPLPLPPLEEQHRIVAIVEDHLSRLDAAEEQLKLAKDRNALLLRSALRKGLQGQLIADDLSEGDATELTTVDTRFDAFKDDRWWPVPASWQWARIGDLFDVNVGATPPRGDRDAWSGDLPWVSSGEVAFNHIASTRESIAVSAAGNASKRIHPPGTVLLAMIGEGKTRGQAAILDIEAAHNQNCASIRVSQTRVRPEYILAYLEERYWETRRGAAGGQQPALNKAAIMRFPVPIAPLGTQHALVAAWDELRTQVRRLDDSLEQLRRRSAGLHRSLLYAALSGRLTGSSAEKLAIAGTIDE